MIHKHSSDVRDCINSKDEEASPIYTLSYKKRWRFPVWVTRLTFGTLWHSLFYHAKPRLVWHHLDHNYYDPDFHE